MGAQLERWAPKLQSPSGALRHPAQNAVAGCAFIRAVSRQRQTAGLTVIDLGQSLADHVSGLGLMDFLPRPRGIVRRQWEVAEPVYRRNDERDHGAGGTYLNA